MTDRREFLKLFGVGTAIIPIIGGIPAASAESKLIEVPKLEIVDKPTLSTTVTGFDVREQCNLTVIIEKVDGRKVMLRADSIILKIEEELLPLRDFRGLELTIVKKQARLRWKLEGQSFSNKDGNVMEITELL